MNIVLLPGIFHRPHEILCSIESIIHSQKNIHLHVLLTQDEDIQIQTKKGQTIHKYITKDLTSELLETFNNHFENFHDHPDDNIRSDFLAMFYLQMIMEKENIDIVWTFSPSTIVLSDLQLLTPYIQIDNPNTSFLSEYHHVFTAYVSREIVTHYCESTIELYKGEGSKKVMQEIYENMKKHNQVGGICGMTIWDWIKDDCFNLKKNFVIKPLHETQLDDSIFDINFTGYDKHFLNTINFQASFESDYTTIEDDKKQLKTVNHKKIFRKSNDINLYYRSSKNGGKTSILSNDKITHRINTIHFNELTEILQLVVWNTIRSTIFPGLTPQTSHCPKEYQSYQTTINTLNTLNDSKNKQRVKQYY